MKKWCFLILAWLTLASSLALWSPEATQEKIVDEKLIKLASIISDKSPIQIKNWVLVADNSNKSMIEQQKFIEEMTNLLKNTYTFKSFDGDDQEWFLEYINEEGILSSYNRIAFIDLLDSESFSKEEKNSLLANFPDLYAWASKISTKSLEHLAKLSFRDVLDKYLETWEIIEWFEIFEKDFKGLKAIIKRWKEADSDILKTKEIKNRIDWIIKKMREMKKNSANLRSY